MESSIQHPKFRYAILLVLCITMLGVQANFMAYAPLLGDIAKNLSVPLGTAVNFMGTLVLFATIALLIGGPINDKYGVIPVILIANLFSGVPALLTPVFGHSVAPIMVIRAFEGLSAGFAMSTVGVIAATWFPISQRSISIAIPFACMPAGAIVGAMGAPALFMGSHNWQNTMALISIPCLVGLVLSVIFLIMPKPARPSVTAPDAPPPDPVAFRYAFRQPFTYIICIVTFSFGWVTNSITDLTGSYIAVDAPAGLGYGPMFGGTVTSITQALAMIAPIILGIVIDKVFKGRAKPVLITIMTLYSVFFFFMQFGFVTQSKAMLILVVIIVGAAQGGYHPSTQNIISTQYPIEIIGKMIAIILGIGNIGGVLGLFVDAAILHATGTYVMAINVIALVGIIGMLVALFGLKQTKPDMKLAARF